MNERPRNTDSRLDMAPDAPEGIPASQTGGRVIDHAAHGQHEAAGSSASLVVAAVPVAVVGTVATTTDAIQQAAYSTFVIPPSVAGVPSVQKIMPYDILRQYAYIYSFDAPIVVGNSSEAASSIANVNAGLTGNSYTGEGDAVAPVSAGETVASLNGGAAIPAGNYVISGSLMLSATATGSDINNMELYVGATAVTILANTDATEVLFSIPAMTITVPAGGAIVAVKIVAAGSGTASFWATFTATPASSGGAVVGVSNPAAALVNNGGWSPPIRHNEALWAANTSTALSTRVTVLVERSNA